MKIIRNSFIILCAIAVALSIPSGFAAAQVTLKVGDKAPMVKGKDQDGKTWKLSDEAGRNMVLLYFYPKDNTPGCTAEACGLRDRIGDLKSMGVDVVGVSFDNEDSHKKFIFDHDLNFRLIADTKGKIADEYGARMSPTRKMDRRISFLISPDGRILHITDSPKASVHLEEMQLAVKKAKSEPAQ